MERTPNTRYQHCTALVKRTMGIGDTKSVVVSITAMYCSKVNGSDLRDNCLYEFTYAV